MLTIKHICTSGSERLAQATEVRLAKEPRDPKEGGTGQQTSHKAVLYASGESGEAIRFTYGTAYVMNDAGATVAKYDLGGCPEPTDEGTENVSKGSPPVG